MIGAIKTVIIITVRKKANKIGQYEPRKTTEIMAKRIDDVLHNHKVCLVKVGTGGGKTYMTIHAVGRISLNANILVVTTASQKKAHEFQKSIDSYNEYYHGHIDYMVTNYDQMTAKNHKFDALNWVSSKPKGSVVMILDEAHKAKNPTSKTTKMLMRISRLPSTSRVIFASATPYTNSLLDSMTYLIMAGFYKNKTQFQAIHVKKYDNFNQPVVRDRSGKVNLNLLNEPEKILKRLHQIEVEINTEKLLPVRHNYQKTFKFNRFVQKEYRQIQKNWRDGLYDSIAEAIAEQRHFVAAHSEHLLDYLKKIIDDKKRPDTPILIFYQYNDELDALVNFLKENEPDYHIEFNNGQSKPKDPSAKPASNKTLVLCQYQAAGEAVNAPWSRTTVFFSPAQSAEKYQQARGRNRRAMQKGDIYHFRLVVKNTINEHYWHDLIDNKQKFTKEVQKRMMEYQD